MVSVADQKRRIMEICENDGFEVILERPIKGPKGIVYLTKAQIGKTALIVVIGPSGAVTDTAGEESV